MACAYYSHTPFIIPELRHVRQEKTTQMPTGKVSGNMRGLFSYQAAMYDYRETLSAPLITARLPSP